jgi:hypothetical protein
MALASTTKAFQNPAKFPPSVAIYLRLSDRQPSMLSRHRVVSAGRKHTSSCRSLHARSH